MFILIGVLFLSVSSVFAETILLKTGKTIEGKIIEKTDKYIKIDIAGVSVPYFLNEIDTIDGKQLSASKEISTATHVPSEKTLEVNSGVNNNEAKSYYDRGVTYATAGNFNQAIGYFNKAIELKPDYADAWGGRGMSYSSKGDFDQALSDFNKVIEINPESAKAYYWIGVIYGRKGDSDRAISAFNKAIERDSKHAEPYVNRSLAYFYKREYDKAWEDVHKAGELGFKVNPKFIEDLEKASGKGNIRSSSMEEKEVHTRSDAGAHLSYAEDYLKAMQPQKALKEFQKASEIDPNNAIAYVGIGHVYMLLKEKEKALANFQKAINMAPSEPEIYLRMGIVYASLHEHEKAIENMTKAISLNPNYAKAYLSLGFLYRESKEYEKAKGNFQKARELYQNLGEKQAVQNTDKLINELSLGQQ